MFEVGFAPQAFWWQRQIFIGDHENVSPCNGDH